MKMEFEDYVTETKKAMTRRNVGNLNFEYSFKKDRSEFCFSWKKFMAKDKIRVSRVFEFLLVAPLYHYWS